MRGLLQVLHASAGGVIPPTDVFDDCVFADSQSIVQRILQRLNLKVLVMAPANLFVLRIQSFSFICLPINSGI